MHSRTKWILAGIATLALLGTAVVAAQGSAAAGSASDLTSPYSGRHVSFGYDAASGTLTDYTADGVRLFDSISLAQFNASAAKGSTHGRVVGFTDGDLARGVAFDAKNAAFRLGSQSGNTVTLVVPEGVGIEYHAGDKGWSPQGVLLRYAQNETARLELRGDGAVNVTGQTIMVTIGAHGHVEFRIQGHPWEAAKERIALMKLGKHLKEKKDKREDKIVKQKANAVVNAET